MTDFENVGVASLAASGKSVKFELSKQCGKFYVSIKDLIELLDGHKRTATLWRPKARGEGERGKGKEQSLQSPGEAS